VNATDHLNAIRERINAATEGPWEVDADDARQIRTAGDGYWVASMRAIYNDEGSDESVRISNAEFIAHARTDLPRLLDAVEKVLELHTPEPCEWCHTQDPNGCEHRPAWCEFCTVENIIVTAYPCATRKAITTALEGK
jgi:hypothetical protein